MFFEKSYLKSGGKTIPGPFSKISQLSISLDQQPKNLYSLFIVESYGNILKLKCRPLSPHIKFFSKNKKGLELLSLTHFLHDF